MPVIAYAEDGHGHAIVHEPSNQAPDTQDPSAQPATAPQSAVQPTHQQPDAETTIAAQPSLPAQAEAEAHAAQHSLDDVTVSQPSPAHIAALLPSLEATPSTKSTHVPATARTTHSLSLQSYTRLIAGMPICIGTCPCACGSPALVQCAGCNHHHFCLACFETGHARQSAAQHTAYMPCPDCGLLTAAFAVCRNCEVVCRNDDAIWGCPACLLRTPQHVRQMHALEARVMDVTELFPRVHVFNQTVSGMCARALLSSWISPLSHMPFSSSGHTCCCHIAQQPIRPSQ